MSTCGCPAVVDCAGAGTSACSVAESYRKSSQRLTPTCGDLDATGNVVVGPDGEALCVVHEPIDPCDYRSSLAVRLQKTVDNARRRAHTLGLRPYRVFLVWRRRDRRQVFVEYRRKELVPVTVSPLTDVDRELRAVGLDQDGGVRLKRISPNQTDEYELRGQITRGQGLGDDEEFFYEIVRSPRHATDLPERHRFTISSVPYYNAKKFQWQVEVTSQHAYRDPSGGDQTLEPAKPPRAGRLEILRR